MTKSTERRELVLQSPVQFGYYFPEHFLTNDEIASWDVMTGSGKRLEPDDILQRVGVEQRTIAGKQETPLFMGTEAVMKMVYDTDISLSDPDAVFVSTSFPQGIHMGRAISDDLGFVHTQKHLDIHAACSGFVLGLTHMKEHEDEYEGRDVLFVATEKYSPYVHNLSKGLGEDPALSQTIFSDGAIAMRFRFGTDIKVLGYQNRVMSESAGLIGMPIDDGKKVKPYLDVPIPYSPEIFQDGRNVFRTVAKSVPSIIEQVTEDAGIDASSAMTFIHQGSRHIVEEIADRLPGHQVMRDFRQGNYSSAAIPKMLMYAARAGQLQSGQKLIVAGFGAGLSISVAALEIG